MEGELHVCSICSKPMTDPRMLPCSHSFCLKCLESPSVLKNPSKCPTCQIEFKIPDGGLECLVKNDFIDKLVCLEHQRKNKTSSNHQLAMTTSTKDESDIKKYKSCDAHLEMMTLFCEDCNIALCSHCLTLKHKNHNFMHLSKYFDSKKVELGILLKMKEECIISDTKKLMRSGIVQSSNELKASNLKEGIQQRGEDLKEVIDSIVAELIKEVDEHMKPYQREAERVTEELKSTLSVLDAQIEAIKQQSSDLSYGNVTETKLTFHSDVNTPVFSEKVNIALFYSRNHQGTNLKKIFGNVGRDLIRASEYELSGNIRSFTTNQDHVFVSYWSNVKVEALMRDGTKVRRPKYFLDEFSKIHDLIAIGNTLFVSGRNKDYYSVVKVLLGSEDCNKVEIHKDQWLGPETFLKMSESSQGNILLNLSDKLLLLSKNGDIIDTIKMSFDVYDALESRPQSYVVCCREEVCIIDDRGDKVAIYSPINQDQRIRFPQFVAKDKQGTIYIFDFMTMHIFVLDGALNYVSSHRLNQRLLKLSYDMERNLLVAVSADNTLLTFSL